MRKILFRGKILGQRGMLPSGSWVDGGYYVDDCYGGCPEGKHYIMVWNSTGLSYFEPLQVERETVGQYTEINDINGKRIFEGDIVEQTGRINAQGIVKFIDGSYVIETFNGKNGWYLFQEIDEVRVIGNIFDNPELVIR